MSSAEFHKEIARLIRGVERVDGNGPADSAGVPYLAGPIPVHLEREHVGDLVCIDTGVWHYEEKTT